MQAKGSKLTRSLSVLLLAPLTAVFGTIVHQSSQFGIPLGLAISLTVVLLVSIQIRRRSGFRSPGVVFAAVLGICIWLFSQDLTGDNDPSHHTRVCVVIWIHSYCGVGGNLAKTHTQSVEKSGQLTL